MFVKKITKHLEPGVLADDEEILAAMSLPQIGGFGQVMGTAGLGVVGGLVGGAIDKRRERKEEEDARAAGDAPEMQIELPKTGALVGLTDRRILAWAASGGTGKPKELVVDRTLDQVAAIDREEQKARWIAGKPKSVKVLIRFTDGSHFGGSTPNMSTTGKAVREFFETYERVRG